MCYACTCALESVRKERGALGRDYCKHYEDDHASAGLWFLVGTVIVVVLNQVIKFAVILTTPFGKPPTVSLQMMQTTTRYAFFACISPAESPNQFPQNDNGSEFIFSVKAG